MTVDLEKQRAFITMLREGFVLSYDDVWNLYHEKPEFVRQVIANTGLDIRDGMMLVTPGDEPGCFFLASDVPQASAGLDTVFGSGEVTPDKAFLDTVEYNDGHYIMWVCPTINGVVPGKETEYAATFCGQFHKVDLGDEELTSPRTVRCSQCGTEYIIKPNAWR
jgi:hypothetical protein